MTVEDNLLIREKKGWFLSGLKWHAYDKIAANLLN
jgi:hypothetical protein